MILALTVALIFVVYFALLLPGVKKEQRVRAELERLRRERQRAEIIRHIYASNVIFARLMKDKPKNG